MWMSVRVAWLGSGENDPKDQVGIEFLEVINFFGVVFPEKTGNILPRSLRR